MSSTPSRYNSELLELVKNETNNCIRCGECRTVCPVFGEKMTERYTARGKMAIAEELAKGNLEYSNDVREVFDNCLLCTGCASQCSSGARADKVILAVRKAYANERGVAPVKKAIGMALSQPTALLNAEARIGAMLQPLLCKKVPETSGLFRRFAMPVVDDAQYIPELADKPFRSRVEYAGTKGQPEVMFFTGCMTNYSMTEIGDNTVKVLNALGIAVSVPQKQACCGMPMLASGDVEPVRKQAIRNIEALTQSDSPIVVACASCGHMLQHGYADMLTDSPELAGKLKSIAERTVDITTYLTENFSQEQLQKTFGNELAEAVTYHDPCHLRKAQGITEAPRALLTTVAPSGFTEMKHPEACCGLGGTYCIANMETSKAIQKKKIDDAVGTHASIIATACPGCIMQLRDGVRRSDKPSTQVEHVVSLLADSLN